ncbi:unnamed protein product [Albugo candida]|uniref:Uncharacterized protein n=1 Tax=Albugo candida TaxID=65357 RepID=A0A024GCD9_9STRA|nr:unnamed protein product [Albugo candida]|eukprot:CCI44405.1 unnamed protein product [Albugo candida]
MTTRPLSPTTDPLKSLMKYAETKLTSEIIPAPEEIVWNDTLSLNAELFDYDFSCERIFLELTQAEQETRRKEEELNTLRSTIASQSNSINESERTAQRQVEEKTSHHDASTMRFQRQSTADDIAIAISASLQDY